MELASGNGAGTGRGGTGGTGGIGTGRGGTGSGTGIGTGSGGRAARLGELRGKFAVTALE